MSLLDKYRPQTLADIVGQPAINMLQKFAKHPHPKYFLLEGPGGVGKTASAYALAAELGCYSDHWFETVHTVCGADLTADAMRRWFGNESPFRLRAPGGWHVLVIEELEEMNKTVHGLAKVAFERGVRDFGRLVVAATSNGAGRLSGPLLQRFDILAYSGGEFFAQVCAERLQEVWAREAPGVDLPQGFADWGWIIDPACPLCKTFSMRMAMRRMEGWLSVLRVQQEVMA